MVIQHLLKMGLLYLYFSTLLAFAFGNLSPRIIGGQEANAGQFPFSAAIYKTTNDGVYFCGGTLLNEEWIVTAGTCVDGATLFRIKLGITKLNSNDGLTLATDYYELHPDYDHQTLKADIGLIKLRMPITFTTYINPVDQLPDSDLNQYTGVLGIGWGQTSDANADLADNLNWVHMTVLSNQECRAYYGNQTIQDDMVCVEGNYNQGICNGDTGGPLIQELRYSSQLVGIASFLSVDGCESIEPSGYTRIFPYNNWIQNITGL